MDPEINDHEELKITKIADLVLVSLFAQCEVADHSLVAEDLDIDHSIESAVHMFCVAANQIHKVLIN